MRKKQRLNNTTNPAEYKRLKRELLLGKKYYSCPICGINDGCNLWRRQIHGDIRNWKRYRKAQWKEKRK